MRSMKGIIAAGSLVIVLVGATAFKNCSEEKMLQQVQMPKPGGGFAVVELFTSEGCSSCPPADALLQTIQAGNKNGQVYVLAYHVDYWDHQGWKDRFSDPAFTNRQRRYAGLMNLQTIYTPQIVVNGTSEHVGSHQGAVLQAISDGLKQASTGTLTLTGSVQNNKLSVGYEASAYEKGAELVLALVQRSAQSEVKAGENEGNHLSHVQVVRKLQQAPIDGNNKTVTISLPADLNNQDWELIGFVQQLATGHITAAARLNIQDLK